MKLSIVPDSDPNYLAVVVTIPQIENHPNADRLQLVEIFGNTIVIGKGSYTVGETVVFFPVESCISKKFLSWANLLDKPELNRDEKTKGYFENKGRVRAVSLRGVPSQGFLFKVSELAKYYEVDEKLFKVGDVFNCVGDDILVTKYVKGTEKVTNPTVKKSRVPKWIDKSIGLFPRPIRIRAYKFVNAWFNRKAQGIVDSFVEGQFAFHYKTEQLGRNVFILKPEDDITISAKVHGCVKHDTPVETLEYGVLPISKIVDEKLAVHVKGYDIDNDHIKWVKVDDYYYKPNDGEWYEVELENGEKLIITGNNPVWMPELQCYRKAEQLKVGDDLLVKNLK